ncbi:MAG: hypothetical protein M1819_004689 [Sarea resinae]|nr:MAG: hypothetical protein M1819_004689 [Sarea resinae]
MKRIRPQRWSGQLLAPRTTRRAAIPAHQYFASSLRFQSTSTVADEAAPSSSSTSSNSSPPTPFVPDSLTSLPSPPPSLAPSSAKLAALHARLSLPSSLPLQTLARCLVDPTADPDPSFNNASLSALGSTLLLHSTAESLVCRFPRLPMSVTYAAMYAYVGPKALATIAREWGLETAAAPGGEVDPGLLQHVRLPPGSPDPSLLSSSRPNANQSHWRRGLSSRIVYDNSFGDLRTPSQPTSDTAAAGTTLEDASSSFVHALFAALYLHAGAAAYKTFFRAHILARHLDMSTLFSFRQPTRDLSRLCAREGFESPVARLVSETGRKSRHPVFVVGVYSGADKLGEGAGGSLDEARLRAAIGALKGWYLYSPFDAAAGGTKGGRVPSDVEGDKAADWKPVMIDGGEVVV